MRKELKEYFWTWNVVLTLLLLVSYFLIGLLNSIHTLNGPVVFAVGVALGLGWFAFAAGAPFFVAIVITAIVGGLGWWSMSVALFAACVLFSGVAVFDQFVPETEDHEVQRWLFCIPAFIVFPWFLGYGPAWATIAVVLTLMLQYLTAPWKAQKTPYDSH